MNLVVFGLLESRKRTRKQLRILKDFQKEGEFYLSSIQFYQTPISGTVTDWGDSRMDPHVHYYFNFIDPFMLAQLLIGRKNLSSRPDIVIKPDLSPSERKMEQLLLRECRMLIESGAQRSSIKLRG